MVSLEVHNMVLELVDHVSQICGILWRLLNNVNKGVAVNVVYLDFSKDFDKVPHNRLINKIKTHGIGCFVANWIESWLSNRYQIVVLIGHMYDWLPVLSGVPQGSVLGPILFIVYIMIWMLNLVVMC